MRGLQGKTAIVSGGATLIGQAVAETLAGYGVSSVRRLTEASSLGASSAMTP